MSHPWTHYRAQVAHAERFGDAERAAKARVDLAISRVEDRIRKAVADAPPLPEIVRTRLVELIRAVPSTVDKSA